jgi:hypothetical protein
VGNNVDIERKIQQNINGGMPMAKVLTFSSILDQFGAVGALTLCSPVVRAEELKGFSKRTLVAARRRVSILNPVEGERLQGVILEVEAIRRQREMRN